MAELCSHCATVAMRTHDTPPHNSVLGWLQISFLLRFSGEGNFKLVQLPQAQAEHLLVGSIDVRHPLPEVELRLYSRCHSLNLQQGSVRALVALATLVAYKYGLCIKSAKTSVPVELRYSTLSHKLLWTISAIP